jgi:ABC-type dipeptide/oligopeptide/nickel transport system permease subunit
MLLHQKFVLVLSATMPPIGDWLRDALNPRLR